MEHLGWETSQFIESLTECAGEKGNKVLTTTAGPGSRGLGRSELGLSLDFVSQAIYDYFIFVCFSLSLLMVDSSVGEIFSLSYSCEREMTEGSPVRALR